MAPVGKKPRRSIGPMFDTVVPETQNQNNANIDPDLDESFSDNNSGNNNTIESPSDDSDDEQIQNSEDDANNQELLKRGHAKMGFEWGTGKVMILELDLENHVVGSNAALFASHLGILAKDGNRLPLSYTDWRAVPNIQKDLVWTEVKENTNLTDNYKKNCLKKIGKLWKDWKNRLKAKHYTPHRHDKSYILSNCPQRVEADQWPKLVNHWSSSNAKKLSKTNKNSRKHVKLPSRMGRKDMASAKEEYRREYGKAPSQVDLFIYSRQRKDGKPIDTLTEEKIALLKELKGKLPENLRDDIDANNKIYGDVIGKEAPQCLRSSSVVAKNVSFTSREEFDKAVQEKSNDIVASIRKGFEEEISKFKDNYSSQMEMLQARLLTLEGHNVNVSGSFNSRRIQAINNGSTSDGFMDMNLENLRESNDNFEMREEINNSDENNMNIRIDDAPPQEQRKRAIRKSKRKSK